MTRNVLAQSRYLLRVDQAEAQVFGSEAYWGNPVPIFVFAYTYQRFRTFCAQYLRGEHGDAPFCGPVEYRCITDDIAVRGWRLYSPDQVIKLCDFWLHPHYQEIRHSVAPCFYPTRSFDLDTHPVTYT